MKRSITGAKVWNASRSMAVVLVSAVLLAGCVGTGKSTTITSEPNNAFIKVNGQNVGTTPVAYPFSLENGAVYRVSAEFDGYRTYKVRVRKDDGKIKSGNLHLVLQEDAAWKQTTNSEATNRWLRLQVDPDIDQQDAWQKIVDSVTTAYDSLEQLDYQSGYVRSIRQVREFDGGPNGPVLIRTQFLGSISSQTPLVYKYKIRAEKRRRRGHSESWEPYDRVFKNDAELVEELQARLSIK